MASVVPVHLRGGMVALESSFRGGVRREVLRSLCQLVNDAAFPLEVALARLPRPSSASASARSFGRADSMVHS